MVGTFVRRGQGDARTGLPLGWCALRFHAPFAAERKATSGKGVNRVETIIAMFVVGLIAIGVMTYIGRAGTGSA
jgi:hypothetical protein